MLITKNIVKEYQHIRILDKTELAIEKPGLYLLYGANGCGKSTLLKILSGFIKPEEGSVFWQEKEITKLPAYERVRAGIAYLPQETALMLKATPQENFALAKRLLRKNARLAKNREPWLQEFGLQGHLESKNKKVLELSRGELRKLEFCITMLHDADLFLLDEPVAGWDKESGVFCLEKLKEVADSQQKYILMCEHRQDESFLRYFNALLYLKDGQISTYTERKLFQEALA